MLSTRAGTPATVAHVGYVVQDDSFGPNDRTAADADALEQGRSDADVRAGAVQPRVLGVHRGRSSTPRSVKTFPPGK